jgi:hypothetical protein
LINKKNKIYKIIELIDGEKLRMYDETLYGTHDTFYSELEVFFNDSIEKGDNFYLLHNTPKSNTPLSNSDLVYLNLTSDQYKASKFVDCSENIKTIKNNQSLDF